MKKWMMFTVLFLCAVTIAMSQLKVPPVMGIISESMNISMGQASWLMSIFTVAGIVLAIPAARIIDKLGAKKLLMSLMVMLCVGNLLGAVAKAYSLLLISRGIEGLAFAMIILVAMTMINGWFGEKAGFAIGIFNTYAALGSFVTMNACLPIIEKLGLKSLWIIVSVMAGVCLVLVGVIIEEPEKAAEKQEKKVALKEVMPNGRMWVLAGALGCISFLIFSYITAYPQLFTEFYKLSSTQANFYASLNGLFGIPFCILAGVIIDKTGKPFSVAGIGFIGLALVAALTTVLGPETYILHTLLTAILFGCVITALFCMAPKTAKKQEHISYTLGFINLVYYVGIFACAPVILGAVESSGWQLASNILVGVALVGCVLVGVLAKVMKKKVI